MDDFLQFLREPIAQRSLLACLMIGFANGFVSGLVILKKSALQIGTLSCALLPGIAVAVLMFGLTRWSLLLGAVVAALLVGLGSLFVSRTSRLNQDTALSILHTTAFAAGFIVLVRLGLQQKIDDWLFGSIMSLSDSDLWIAFAISAASVLTLLLFRRPILIYLFDPDIATTLGIPSRLISYGIFTLIILVPLMIFAGPLCSLFNQETEVIGYGVYFIRLISPFYLLANFNQIYAGALRGAGDAKMPMFIMLGSFVVFRQIYLYVMANYISNEIVPIALSYPAGWFVCSAATLLYYTHCKFDHYRLVEDV